MTTPKRKRNIQLNFRVTAEELKQIEEKMGQLGVFNREAYLRKMALDGYAVKLDLPELKELLSLLRRSSNNLNQLVRRVNSTGRVYQEDLADLSRRCIVSPYFSFIRFLQSGQGWTIIKYNSQYNSVMESSYEEAWTLLQGLWRI